MQNKGVQRLEPFVPNADTKPANKRKNHFAINQMFDKNWQKRGKRLSRTKQKNRGGLKNGTKRRAVSKRKALKKQRVGRGTINGNKSKKCQGKKNKSKICRGRTSTRRGRQIKHQRNARWRGLRKKLNMRCNEKGSKRRRRYCRKRKGRKRGGRTLPRTGDQ